VPFVSVTRDSVTDTVQKVDGIPVSLEAYLKYTVSSSEFIICLFTYSIC
jgi:hypothetical protein